METASRPATECSRRTATSVLACAIAVGAVLRFWGLTFGLPNTEVRPDETAVVGVAIGLLFAGLNPRFFHWPSLMFYAVALLYRLWWEVGHWRGIYDLKFDMYKAARVNPTPYVMVPRALAAATGVLTILLLYRVTLALFDRLTAATAAVLIALAFLHVRDSHFGVTDVPMTALAVGAMIPVVHAFRDPERLGHWLWAGVLAGLTASTKYNGGLVVLAGLAVAVIHLRDGRISRNAFFRATAVLALASLLGFVVGTPFSLIDFRGFADGLRFDAHHLATGHGIVLGRGWVYHSTFSLWYALGPPLLITSIGGLALLTARSWRRAVVVGIFPVLYFLAIGRGYTVFVRYIIPVVPFLCIAGAVAIAAAAKGLAPRIRVPAAVLATAAALLLSIPSAVRAIAFDRIISRPDTRLLAAAWIDARLQPAEWIGEVSPASLHPSFGRAPGVRVASFDSPRGVFLSDGGEIVTPTWIALAQSPLSVYNTVPSEVVNTVASDYTLAETFLATRGPEAPAWFDQQDMFFVPYATLSMRDRPGPDIRIYRHRE